MMSAGVCDTRPYRHDSAKSSVARAVPGVMRADFDLSYGPIILLNHSEKFSMKFRTIRARAAKRKGAKLIYEFTSEGF